MKGCGKTIYWILIVQLLFPPQFFATSLIRSSHAATPSETQQPPKGAATLPTTYAAGSRAATLNSFLLKSAAIHSLVKKNIEGVLTHHMQAAQMIFSPVSRCLVPVGAGDPLKLTDELLTEAAKDLFTFIANREEQLGKVDDNRQTDFTQVPLVETIYYENEPCNPESGFNKPASTRQSQQDWKLQIQLATEAKWRSETQNTPGNLYYQIGYKSEKAPLTNEELDQWLSWLNWLVEFRQGLAIQAKLRQEIAISKALNAAKDPKAPKVVQAPIPELPKLAIDGKVGRTLLIVLDEARGKTAYKDLKEQGEKRLTLAQITTKKLLQASSKLEKLPNFEPCGQEVCFVQAKREPADRLKEKVLVALQDPSLGPGTYLDAMVALAKQASIIELIALNSFLPKHLRFTELPSTVAASFQDPNQFAAEEFKDLIEQFHSLQKGEHRYWWAHQLGVAFQQMVYSIQTRQNKLLIPPKEPNEFEVKVAGKKPTKITIYERANQIVASFVEEFLSIAERSESLNAAERENITTAKTNVLTRLKQQSFDVYLKNQLGLDTLDDVSSLMAEKLLVLTALIRPNLVENLSKAEWNNREQTYLPLLNEVVTSTLTDSLAQFAFAQLNTPELVKVMPDGTRKPVFASLFAQAAVQWREQQGLEWLKLLKSEAGADTWEIAKDLHSSLLKTDAMVKLQSLTEEKQSDAIVEQVVAERVRESSKLIEEAARAEETAQYMAELTNWKDSPVWNFSPGLTNYYALERMGANQGPNAACFSVDNRKLYFFSGAHGTGRNTLGALNPEQQDDYLQLKVGLQSMAEKRLKDLEKRLDKRSDIQSILKTYGVKDTKSLATSIYHRYLELLEAKPAFDRVRPSLALEEKAQPLIAWLEEGANRRKTYDAIIEQNFSSVYRKELAPIAQAWETAQTKEVKEGWERHAEEVLKGVNKKLEPILARPIQWETIAKARAKSSQKEVQKSLEVVKQIDQLQEAIAETKVFDRPKDLKQKESVPFITYCKEHKDICLGWFTSIEKLLDEPALGDLYSARLSLVTTEKLMAKGLESVAQPEKLAKTSDTIKSQIVRDGWLGKELAGEAFFWFPELYKNDKGVVTEPDDKDTWFGTFNIFMRASGGKLEGENFVNNELGTYIEGVIDSVVPTYLAPREEFVTGKLLAQLNAFLETLSKRESLSREELLEQSWEQSKNQELYNGWKSLLKNLSAAGQTLIRGHKTDQHDVLLEMTYPILRILLTSNLVSLSQSDRVALLQSRAEKPILRRLEKYALNWEQFKTKTENLIASVKAPQIDPQEQIIEIDKRIRSTDDALSNNNYDLKGYEDSKVLKHIPSVPLTGLGTQMDALEQKKKIGDEQIAELQRQRQRAVQRRDRRTELKELLSLTANQIAAAKPLLEGLGNTPPDAAELIQSAHDHALHAPRLRAKHTLSAAKIFEDLSYLSTKNKDYPDVEPELAKSYLAEIKTYFVDGPKMEAALPYLQRYYMRTIAQWMAVANSPKVRPEVRERITDQLKTLTKLSLSGLSTPSKVYGFFLTHFSQTGKNRNGFRHGLTEIAPELASDIRPLSAAFEQQIASLTEEFEQLPTAKEGEVFRIPEDLRKRYWEFAEFTSHLVRGQLSEFRPIVFEGEAGKVESIWVDTAPTQNTVKGEHLLNFIADSTKTTITSQKDIAMLLKRTFTTPARDALTAVYLVLRQPQLTKATFDEIWPPSLLSRVQITEPRDWTREGLRTWLLEKSGAQINELYLAVGRRFQIWLHNDDNIPTIALGWERSTPAPKVAEYETLHKNFVTQLNILLSLWQSVASEVRDRAELPKKEEEEPAPAVATAAIPSNLGFLGKLGAVFSGAPRPVVDPKIPSKNPTAMTLLAESLFTLFTHSTQYRFENGDFVVHEKDRNYPTKDSDAAFADLVRTNDYKGIYRAMSLIEGIVRAEMSRSTLQTEEAKANFFAGRQRLDQIASDGLLPFYGDTSDNRPVKAPYFNGKQESLTQPAALFFSTMASVFDADNQDHTPGQIWGYYFNRELEFQNSIEGYSPAFTAQWRMEANDLNEAKRFETWFDYLASSEAKDRFIELRKQSKAAGGGERLWDYYESLDDLKKDPTGAYAQAKDFLAKWDKNAAAKPAVETYPYLMASLSKHLQLPLAVAKSDKKKDSLPPQVVSHLLEELLAELEIDVEDFSSYKHVLSKAESDDILAISLEKKHALVEIGHRRLLSVRVDAPVVHNPEAGVDYNHRPFPLVFLDEKDMLQPSGLELATKHPAPQWIKMTENFDKSALYRTLGTDDKMIPLHQDMLATKLELQDGAAIELQETSLKDFKNQIDRAVVARYTDQTDKKTTPLEASVAVVHNRYDSNRENWEGYFSKIENDYLAPEAFAHLLASVEAETKTSLNSAQVTDILRKRTAFVALVKAVNELVRAYSFDQWKLKQKRGNSVLNAELITLNTEAGPKMMERAVSAAFGAGLEQEVNALLNSYKKQIGSRSAAKIELHRVLPEGLRREASGKAIYVAWHLLQASLPKTTAENYSAEAEKVRRAADKYFEEKVNVRKYWRGLLQIGKNIIENVGVLFSERDLRFKILNEEQFMAEAPRIWKLKLPLMDNLTKMIAESFPSDLGTQTRHMLQSLVIKEEVERRKDEEFRQIFYTGMLAGLVAGWSAPQWLGKLGIFAQQYPVATAVGAAGFSGGMGYLFIDSLYHRIDEDFWGAPGRLAIEQTIRDSHVQAFQMLMRDETAFLRDASLRNLEATQTSAFYWLMRAVDSFVIFSTVALPVTKLCAGGARMLYSSVRPIAIRNWRTGGDAALKAANEERMLHVTASKANSALSNIGMSSGITSQTPAEAQLAIEQALDERFAAITHRLAKDGLGQAEKPLRNLLDARAERRIQSIGQSVGLDLTRPGLPARPSKMVNLKNEKVAQYQDQQRLVVKQLREFQTRLRMDEPLDHFSVDDLAALFADETSIVKATTWLPVRTLGITWPASWRFGSSVSEARELQLALQSGMKGQQAVSYYFLAKWTKRTRTILSELAETSGGTQKEWIERILKNEVLFEGELVPIRLPGVEYKELLSLADELRDIFKIGNIQMTDELTSAMATSDFGALYELFRATKPTNFVSQGSLVLQRPIANETAAANTAAAEGSVVGTTGTATTTPVSTVAGRGFSLESGNLMETLGTQYGTRRQVIQDFDAIETMLRDKLPTSVDGIFIDRDAVIAAIREYPSLTLRHAVGEHMKWNGVGPLTEKAAQTRLAGEWRRAIELDLGITSPSMPINSTYGANGVSKRLLGMYESNLKDAGKIISRHLRANGRAMPLEERKALYDLADKANWTLEDLKVRKVAFEGNESALQIAKETERLHFKTRIEEGLNTYEDLYILHDIAPEYLSVKGMDGILKQFSTASIPMNTQEKLFLMNSVATGEITTTKASQILGFLHNPANLPSVAEVNSRAKAIVEELDILYGANARSALGGRTAPEYVNYELYDRIERAREVLNNAVR